MTARSNVFAVSRNRAVWKCYDTIDAAREHLEALAPRVEFLQHVTGFDASGVTAIVEAPVDWRVEEIEPLSIGRRRIADRLRICPACRSVVPAWQSCGCSENEARS